ncbi:hypothetical protein BGZ93_006822 [Podila epicladia]|nr:hypothetical protein BGZ93_006822 [Podila epicladia]
MAVTADLFSFRPAEPKELDIFIDILERAAEWMVANKLNQWIPGSFVAPNTRSGTIIGTFTLNYTDAFDEMLWKDLVEDWSDAVYLHRLVVEREYKGYGLGPKALMFAEVEGLKRGKHYLRLDCMADNKLLKAYYREKAHFKELEDYPGERLFGRFERPITATLA